MADARYAKTPKGKQAKQRKDSRYKATINGYWKRRKRELEAYRARILEQLSNLVAEDI